MTTLSWEQTNAWRLGRHRLVEPAARDDMVAVVSDIFGLHGQVMSSAAKALWTRIPGATATELENALTRDRTLVKSWAMRGTLHVLAADDLALFAGARSATQARRPPSYYTYHGVTPGELDAITEGVRTELGATPMTREQLAGAIAERTHNPKLREVLGSGWGSLLKPSAFAGDLCFGPPQGQNVTFVRPERWLGTWRRIEPEAALREVARRYFASYGPATPDDFARWWGFDAAAAKRLFRSLAGELVEVDIQGWTAWALGETVEAIEQARPELIVRLLPGFDPYVVALLRHPSILPETHRARVSRPQGWISPAVLVDGRILGVWESETRRSTTVIRVSLWEAPALQLRTDIEAEAQRLAGFLDTAIETIID